MSVLAENYKCNLAVWVNNTAADPQQMNISATKQADGKYTLELKNFILYSEGQPLAVGNITVNDIDATEDGDSKVSISTAQGIMIEAGDAEGVDFGWGQYFAKKDLSTLLLMAQYLLTEYLLQSWEFRLAKTWILRL